MRSSIRFVPRANNTNLAEEIPKTLPLPAAKPEIKVVLKKKREGRNLVARVSINSENHSADAFTNKNDIDNILLSLLMNCKSSSKRKFTKALAFLFVINTGYRAGDGLIIRVRDVLDDNGNIKDYIFLNESKTGKSRKVYFNKAVKMAIQFLIEVNHLTLNNYLFVGEGNRTAYIHHIEYDECGKVIKTVTTGEKYDDNGVAREVAPYCVSSLSRIIIQEAKKLGLEGHFSSHCMRKTFAEFISRDWVDNRNPIVASKALNHSDVRTTVEYYLTIDSRKLKAQWLNLNLGLEVLEMFIEDYYNGKFQFNG
jgi:integrase